MSNLTDRGATFACAFCGSETNQDVVACFDCRVRLTRKHKLAGSRGLQAHDLFGELLYVHRVHRHLDRIAKAQRKGRKGVA